MTMGSGGLHSDQALSLAQRRERFRATWAQGLAEDAAGGPVGEFTRRDAGMALSKRLCWYHSPGRLVVIAGPYQGGRDVDLALAFGLYHAGEDDILVMVLPDEETVTRATLVRAPWISRPLEIWTYDLEGLERGEPRRTARRELAARSEVIQKYRDPEPKGWGYGTTPPRPDDHRSVLGEQARWVDDLASWLVADLALDAEHTKGYLAWKCAGKIVLRIRRTSRKLTLTAGIQYSDPERGPVEVSCSAPLTADELSALKAGVTGAVAELLQGFGGRYREHRLQAVIARQRPAIMGLDQNLVSECPAWRPYPRPKGRAFLDFLGVDENQTLHVIETKVGGDVMMVLQGLDYWIWASANAKTLAEYFGLEETSPKVVMDFLVSKDDHEELLGPYSEAQSRSLAAEVVHRFWEISDGERGGVPRIDRLPLA